MANSMDNDPFTPTAKLVTVETEDVNGARIKALEVESRRYPFSPVFKETIALLKEQNKPLTKEVIQITISKEQASKLYGLLGQITQQSGLDPIFRALNNAPFGLRRNRPRLKFVSDSVIKAEF